MKPIHKIPDLTVLKENTDVIRNDKVFALVQSNGLDFLYYYCRIVDLLKKEKDLQPADIYCRIGAKIGIDAGSVKKVICWDGLFEYKKGSLPIAKELDLPASTPVKRRIVKSVVSSGTEIKKEPAPVSAPKEMPSLENILKYFREEWRDKSLYNRDLERSISIQYDVWKANDWRYRGGANKNKPIERLLPAMINYVRITLDGGKLNRGQSRLSEPSGPRLPVFRNGQG